MSTCTVGCCAVGTPARTRLDENFTIAIAQACAKGLMAKQPLVDPKPRMENTDGINEGGGLHADHDDHEPVAS